jgi:hypothetical protein
MFRQRSAISRNNDGTRSVDNQAAAVQGRTGRSQHGRLLAPAEVRPCRGGQNESKGKVLSYKMVAERDNETVRIERVSVLVVVAKARVWASEGWHVEIIDANGKTFSSADFESLSAAA